MNPTSRIRDTADELLAMPAARAARQVALRLLDAGFETYFAGGCVRDALLGREPRDFDLATAALPGQVEALFPRTLDVGRAFGVMVVRQPGASVEVATFRTDGDYADGRRPSSVRFRSAREDALRRDFTINALFLDPRGGAVIDHVGGRQALAERVVETVGEAARRFEEDHLRMLRAVRFAATLEFTITPATFTAIRQLAGRTADLSGERVGQELLRILGESRRAGGAVRLLAAAGLLRVLLPEVDAMRGVEQPPRFHPEGDVFTHTCNMLDGLPEPPRDVRLALAVLLHDVGKPPTFAIRPDAEGRPVVRFMGHAARGAAIAERLLRRLRLGRDLVAEVAGMVRRHMTFLEAPNMRPATLRRYLAAPGFPLELQLMRLDAQHSNGDMSHAEFVARRFAELRDEPALPDPWVRGEDLLALGVPEGPEIGRWLRIAHDRQIEGLSRSREALIGWLRGALKRREGG